MPLLAHCVRRFAALQNGVDSVAKRGVDAVAAVFFPEVAPSGLSHHRNDIEATSLLLVIDVFISP